MQIYKILGLILTIVGLFFGIIFGVVSAIFNGVIRNHTEDWDEVTAYISDYTNNSAYVDYMYDGDEYTNVKLGSKMSTMKIGQKWKIYVNPDAPTKVFDGVTFRIISMVFIGVAAFFGVVWIVGMVLLILWRREVKKNEAI